MRRVVVTGGSSISALGINTDLVFENLYSLKNKIVRIKDWDKYEQMNTRLACPVEFSLPDYPRKLVVWDESHYLPFLQQMKQ